MIKILLLLEKLRQLISDVLLWIPTYGHASIAMTYQLWGDTGYCLEKLQRIIKDKHESWERVKELWAMSTWWWCCHYSRLISDEKRNCLNFRDEVRWFLSLRVFRLLSSSLLLFPQHFSRYVIQPSSGVCWTRKTTQNFELCPLLKSTKTTRK